MKIYGILCFVLFHLYDVVKSQQTLLMNPPSFPDLKLYIADKALLQELFAEYSQSGDCIVDPLLLSSSLGAITSSNTPLAANSNCSDTWSTLATTNAASVLSQVSTTVVHAVVPSRSYTAVRAPLSDDVTYFSKSSWTTSATNAALVTSSPNMNTSAETSSLSPPLRSSGSSAAYVLPLIVVIAVVLGVVVVVVLVVCLVRYRASHRSCSSFYKSNLKNTLFSSSGGEKSRQRTASEMESQMSRSVQRPSTENGRIKRQESTETKVTQISLDQISSASSTEGKQQQSSAIPFPGRPTSVSNASTMDVSQPSSPQTLGDKQAVFNFAAKKSEKNKSSKRQKPKEDSLAIKKNKRPQQGIDNESSENATSQETLDGDRNNNEKRWNELNSTKDRNSNDALSEKKKTTRAAEIDAAEIDLHSDECFQSVPIDRPLNKDGSFQATTTSPNINKHRPSLAAHEDAFQQTPNTARHDNTGVANSITIETTPVSSRKQSSPSTGRSNQIHYIPKAKGQRRYRIRPGRSSELGLHRNSSVNVNQQPDCRVMRQSSLNSNNPESDVGCSYMEEGFSTLPNRAPVRGRRQQRPRSISTSTPQSSEFEKQAATGFMPVTMLDAACTQSLSSPIRPDYLKQDFAHMPSRVPPEVLTPNEVARKNSIGNNVSITNAQVNESQSMVNTPGKSYSPIPLMAPTQKNFYPPTSAAPTQGNLPLPSPPAVHNQENSYPSSPLKIPNQGSSHPLTPSNQSSNSVFLPPPTLSSLKQQQPMMSTPIQHENPLLLNRLNSSEKSSNGNLPPVDNNATVFAISGTPQASPTDLRNYELATHNSFLAQKPPSRANGSGVARRLNFAENNRGSVSIDVDRLAVESTDISSSPSHDRQNSFTGHEVSVDGPLFESFEIILSTDSIAANGSNIGYNTPILSI